MKIKIFIFMCLIILGGIKITCIGNNSSRRTSGCTSARPTTCVSSVSSTLTSITITADYTTIAEVQSNVKLREGGFTGPFISFTVTGGAGTYILSGFTLSPGVTYYLTFPDSYSPYCDAGIIGINN